MDDTTDLKDRIREISDSLAFNRSSETANSARRISSSVGVETPVVVLSDIRDVQCKTLEVLKDIRSFLVEVDKVQEHRHKELCTVLLGATSGISAAAPRVGATGQEHPTGRTGVPRQQYYYGSTTILNGSYLLGCIMMHLDLIAREHPFFSRIRNTDNTVADTKSWFNLVSMALNSDKDSKVGLRLPKPGDDDFSSACRIVASPVEGRRPSCDLTHFNSLLVECPALMNTVEWLRQALVKCKGVLSPERECRLGRIAHPFIGEDQELRIANESKLVLPNRAFHSNVALLKATKKKKYMALVLGNSIKPADALAKASEAE